MAETRDRITLCEVRENELDGLCSTQGGTKKNYYISGKKTSMEDYILHLLFRIGVKPAFF